MASQSKSTPSKLLGPEVAPSVGLQLLSKLRGSGAEMLVQRPISKDVYSRWTLLARNYLEKAFGKTSPNVTSITNVGRFGSVPLNADESWWESHRATSLQSQLAKVDALIELLETEVTLTEGHAVAPQRESGGHRIFLVHGHDEGALHETARFLERLHQEVIVLREQANEGRTIVEKFEAYSDVGFAVVLLTDDDLGGAKAVAPSNFSARARQNVIFELGFFNGRLGRKRVCALYRPGVEIPSDYAGVLYIALDDAGAWKLQLAKELRAAGFSVDMNDALA